MQENMASCAAINFYLLMIYSEARAKVTFLKSFLSFIGIANKSEQARYLPVYAALMAQARAPFLFGQKEERAPDTFDGRFDVLIIHVYLVLRRLRCEDSTYEAGHEAGQVLVDLFFQDMDQALREMGVGDVSVGKKIKKMAEAFYGRLKAYDMAFDAEQDAPQSLADNLAETIARNLYPEKNPTQTPTKTLATYMQNLNAYLLTQSTETILSRDIFKTFKGAF